MCQNLLVPVEIFTERHLTFMMDLSSSVVHFSSVQKHICSLFFSQYYFFCFHQSWFENLPVRPAFITNLSCTNFVVKSLLQNIWKVNVFIWKIEKFWQIVLVLPLYHRNSNSRRLSSPPLHIGIAKLKLKIFWLLILILILQRLTQAYKAPAEFDK